MAEISKPFHGKDKDNFIQIWRAIAVVLVIYYHFADRIPAQYLGMESGPTVTYHSGKIGVLIFFAISGYLITQSLFNSKNLASFYAKRVSRIWPLFILAAITTFTFLQFFDPPVVPDGAKRFYNDDHNLTDLFGTIFFLEDLGFRWVDGVYWSIVVELKFYLYIGLLAYLRPSTFIRDFSILALVVAVAEMGLSVSGDPQIQAFARPLNGVFIAQYMPFFAIGALLFADRYRHLLTLLIIVALLQGGLKSASNPDFNMQHTVVFGLCLLALIAVDHALFKNWIFLKIGDYSYSWYLFHQMIGLTIIKGVSGFMSYDLALVLALTSTLAIAVVGSWAAEWRFRGLFYDWLMKAFSILSLQRLSFSLARPSGTA